MTTLVRQCYILLCRGKHNFLTDAIVPATSIAEPLQKSDVRSIPSTSTKPHDREPKTAAIPKEQKRDKETSSNSSEKRKLESESESKSSKSKSKRSKDGHESGNSREHSNHDLSQAQVKDKNYGELKKHKTSSEKASSAKKDTEPKTSNTQEEPIKINREAASSKAKYAKETKTANSSTTKKASSSVSTENPAQNKERNDCETVEPRTGKLLSVKICRRHRSVRSGLQCVCDDDG